MVSFKHSFLRKLLNSTGWSISKNSKNTGKNRPKPAEQCKDDVTSPPITHTRTTSNNTPILGLLTTAHRISGGCQAAIPTTLYSHRQLRSVSVAWIVLCSVINRDRHPHLIIIRTTAHGRCVRVENGSEKYTAIIVVCDATEHNADGGIDCLLFREKTCSF